MSGNDNEDLIDYEDEHEIVANGSTAASATNGAAAGAGEGKDKDKKNFSGIHSTGFRDFLLTAELRRAISDLGFEHPSEVQQECIPQAVLGMDVLCQAKSGHGKTAVFVLATLQQLEPVNGEVSVIVLCHTRELAFQIKNEYTRFAKYMPDVRVSTFFGGTPVTKDAEILRDKSKCPHIVVATPGRLNALVRDKVLDAKNVKHFVLDECDKMLEQLALALHSDLFSGSWELGFGYVAAWGRLVFEEPPLEDANFGSDHRGSPDSIFNDLFAYMRRDVQEIFRATPHHKQVMMFSATLAKEIRATCKKFMANPLEIFVDDETKLTLHGLQQHYVKLEEKEKNRKLNDLLDNLEFNQVVIFVKSVARAIELDKLLVSCNFPSISIHSGLQQEERINRYTAFKAFEKRILVATDIFGRGIDVERVNIVVNYDCPPDADSYLHRVGRAGRFGTKGLAITFVSSESDQQVMAAIQSRFEVAVPELPDHIDPASYNCLCVSTVNIDAAKTWPANFSNIANRWCDTGSLTLLAEGSSLKDGSRVLAKIAPVATNGSQCLEREAHVLGRVAKSNRHGTILPLLENLKIPREHGDCVVLILAHPGPNLLGRYLPLYKINDLLLADVPRTHSNTVIEGSLRNEEEMATIETTDKFEAEEETPIMDLASFLEYEPFSVDIVVLFTMFVNLGFRFTRHVVWKISIGTDIRSFFREDGSLTCFHLLSDRLGIIHREVRANAFHLNPHSGLVRLVHFGNRAISLENYGSPSSLVLRAPEDDKLKVKEALCYLAPEQTGSIETMTQDHRTDLYSLGILFWTLLVGRGQMPFEGQPLELLHAIVQKRPMPVHDVRRDVPQLLAKSPDARYQSAHGLQKDLLECQRRLLLAVSSTATDSGELIPQFEIAKEDRFMEFTLPLAMFGREKELDAIGSVIEKVSKSFSEHFSNHYDVSNPSSSTTPFGTGNSADEQNDIFSTSLDSPILTTNDAAMSHGSVSSPSAMATTPLSNSRTIALPSGPNTQTLKTQTIIIVGPAGIGKSSLILVNQAKWRSHGLWGQAKFQVGDSAPFAALLGCLSSVLRQLMVFPTDLHRFVTRLQEKLGPQLQSVSLLYQGTPELQDVLAKFGIVLQVPTEHLAPIELRARFQSLVESVFSVIAETRLFALFLDDLHDADGSNALDRVRKMFANRSEPTWIFLDPLSYSAISSLVSQTLHRSSEEVDHLTQYVYKASSGNAFSARSVLTTLQKQHHILFDWGKNHWTYDMQDIEGDAHNHNVWDPIDVNYLTAHMRELSEEARKYLTWAAFFGETFKITEVALMMDWEDSSGSSSDEEADNMWNDLHRAKTMSSDTSNTRASMRGLQLALQEGWLVQRAREMCTWTHDRYRQAAQAEVDALPSITVSKMSLRIILMMLLEKPIDVYRIAEHAKRCLPLLLENPKRDELLNVMMDAGESAWARGAHETLYLERHDFEVPFFISTAELTLGDYGLSNSILEECEVHARTSEDLANTLRLKSRNHFFGNNFAEAMAHTLRALKHLGVELNPSPSEQEADAMFHLVKNEILAVGFEEIMMMPRASDKKTELAITLLNDAGLNSYWMPSSSTFADIVGLTTIQLALRHGMVPGTALGVFWALGAVAEKRELYRFSVDLGKLAIMIAEKHGSAGEKCRAQVLFCAMVSGYDSVHIRANIARLEKAIKYGNGAGDRMYTCIASVHALVARLYVCQHLSELLEAAEECFGDVKLWGEGGDPAILAIGVLNCIRALGGYTIAQSSETLFDTESFKESEFRERISAMSGGSIMILSWYNPFKVVAYYCTGYIDEAAELGFSVFASRHGQPKHIRYSLFFHSLAMIACLRRGRLSESSRQRYLSQIAENQMYNRKWLSPSPVNTSTWIALVEAEMASLKGSSDAFRLYDVAVRLAVENDWILEEGWALRGAILRDAMSKDWERSLRETVLTHEVGVQTSFDIQPAAVSIPNNPAPKPDVTDHETSLCADDLAAILRWSKDISSDINLSSALQRLTEIVTETSASLNTCVIIAREVGDYTVATSMISPGMCKVHENPKPIRDIDNALQKAIIQHALNVKEAVHFDDASIDSRFSTEAGQTSLRSVFCVPMFSNRNQTFAAVFISSNRPFSRNTITKLTLLYQQASISISNALLFRSVQAGTKDNLKMIATQRDALEAARKSREDALKATKVRKLSARLNSLFLSLVVAVQTAKNSCELLLKIIDSILDYSKLEASGLFHRFALCAHPHVLKAVKLEPELLFPMAVKKLDLSFNIEANVPAWVFADYARIRQVLMNLIGNAVKFTAKGSVRVTCSVVERHGDEDAVLRDTGIGLSPKDVDLLFVPFRQADNSSTRRFGGTGLGLSISSQLVKLMGGAIAVQSKLNYLQDIQQIKLRLMTPSPPKILVCSKSIATLTFLHNILGDFHVERVSSIHEAKSKLQNHRNFSLPLDFIILDEQSEDSLNDIVQFMHQPESTVFKESKVIHLYTPTTNGSGQLTFGASSIPGVVKMTKPPRTARILHTLAELKHLPNTISQVATAIAKVVENAAGAPRTLRDNPIAQNLLVKQLERVDLKVTATGNGEEALAAWEAHEPGYYSVALFDHHMPVCDGVEATKRLRHLESIRKCEVCLPIVALSADCQESTKQLCLSAGMNAFFSKPLKKGDLTSLLSMFPTSS
ncbi:hypothetical protein H0H93_013063 [Arthromyces matolae]|nr:hypothetical protein H0H93_013063 [Arthromyces matolae]